MTKIGCQLWTVRDQQDDVGPLFEQLAAVGVEAVEPFGLGNPETDVATRIARAREIRRAADDAGLEIISTHTRLPAVADAAVLVDEMRELGVSYALSSAPEHLSGFERDMLLSRDRIRQYAETINALADAVEPAGLHIGYHNHYWEWNELDGGTLAYDLLWENLGPKIVVELDVLWAAFAGQDAVAIADRLQDRIRFLHVGDAAPVTNRDHQLPTGAGDSPIAAALDAAGPVDAVFIEATTPPPGSTSIDLVGQSVEWLRTALAERGR
jgi:sugar phosphate isomerase/epimerase